MNIFAVISRVRRDEKGSVLILTLMLLAILTVLGLAATQSSWFEVSIASNDRLFRNSFTAAESTLSEVIGDPVVLGEANLDEPQLWPDDANPRAEVEYLGASSGATLRGSGYSAGKFRAHTYQIDAVGEAPRGGRSTVSVAGYRVGF